MGALLGLKRSKEWTHTKQKSQQSTNLTGKWVFCTCPMYEMENGTFCYLQDLEVGLYGVQEPNAFSLQRKTLRKIASLGDSKMGKCRTCGAVFMMIDLEFQNVRELRVYILN